MAPGSPTHQQYGALDSTPIQYYRTCYLFRRRFKLSEAESPPEIEAFFDKYTENGVMNADQMRRFLVEVQGDDNATAAVDAQAVMDEKGLNREGFFGYLFGDANPPLNPKIGVHHDMTAPLSDYFIYTGHNSYLTGNQLTSVSSDVPIIEALHNGVRVIELDLWPLEGNIIVYHGWTPTTPVDLITCLKSIKEHAFATSEYPVLITLEDHLKTREHQDKLAKMLKQTFQDMLFSPPHDNLSVFPSPDSLKGKVLISTKLPKKSLQDKIRERVSKKGEDKAKEVPWGREDMDEDLHEDGEGEGEEDPINAHKIVAPEYRHLICIHAGRGKGGMKDWLKVDTDKVRRLSLSEGELKEAAKTHAEDVVRFTRNNLLRVYPKGMRVDSSNYNPLLGWMHGAQMVAFNMQGDGRPLWLMHGMFRANGGCGYVKKPDLMLNGDGASVFDPKVALPPKTTLKVTLYMGEGWYYDFNHTYFDYWSPPDFYAMVGIAGVPADVVMKKTKKTCMDEWIPAWNEVFEFPLTVPGLALLWIEVHDYDTHKKDDFGGQTCLPVPELREGIRAVPLHSGKGEKFKSTKLLMRFEFI